MAVALDNLWATYLGELAAFAAGPIDPKKEAFCSAGMTLNIDLINADAGIVNQTVYQIGNTIPAWSPGYTAKSDLATTYALFLDYVDLKGDPNPNLDPLISDAAAAMTTAEDNYWTQYNKAQDRYTLYLKTHPGVTFEDFVQQMGAVLTDAKTALDAASAEYEKLMTQKYGPGFATLADARKRVGIVGGARDSLTTNRFNMLVKTGAVAIRGATPILPGQTAAVPDSQLKSLFAPTFGLTGFNTTYKEWQAKSAAGVVEVGPIAVSGGKVARSMEQYGWSGSGWGGFGSWFFGYGGYGHDSVQEVRTSGDTTKTSMKVSFTGLASFVIQPGEWFLPGIIATYHNQLKPGAPAFFGEQGSLGLLPSRAVIGFEPKLELQFSESDYATMKQTMTDSGTHTVYFGPFAVGRQYWTSTSEIRKEVFNDQACAITVGPVKSQMPLLLGMVCTKL